MIPAKRIPATVLDFDTNKKTINALAFKGSDKNRRRPESGPSLSSKRAIRTFFVNTSNKICEVHDGDSTLNQPGLVPNDGVQLLQLRGCVLHKLPKCGAWTIMYPAGHSELWPF